MLGYRPSSIRIIRRYCSGLICWYVCLFGISVGRCNMCFLLSICVFFFILFYYDASVQDLFLLYLL